jgi:TRAP-type C4-dicarboxylate transport system permease small subunit
MISMSFQLVGFLLTYLLHTTHAAKNGSRAGLGITLVQYGFYMKGSGSSKSPASGAADPSYSPPDPNAYEFSPEQVANNAAAATAEASSSGRFSSITSSEWLAYALMIVGWLILLRAISDFLRARRHEQLVLQSPDRGLNVPVIATGEEAETVV